MARLNFDKPAWAEGGEAGLFEWLASVKDDPLAFVLGAFPWRQPGTVLENFDGPSGWTRELFEEIRRGLNSPNRVIQLATASGHGIGKAQALDTLVPTPTGYKFWGDLVPGDQLFGVGGAPVTILETRHYTKIPMYRVKFDDGSYTDVSSGHLWNVRGRIERRRGLHGWRTVSTEYLKIVGVTRSNGEAEARQWEIPIQASAQYPKRKLTNHPYVMGLWLSDGCSGTKRISKLYPEPRGRLTELGVQWHGSPREIFVDDLVLDNEVFYLGSHERYIPEDYLLSSVEDRWELFRGLCDGDGGANQSGSVGYSTTSEQLARDVLELARSLGFKAMLHPTIHCGAYEDEYGDVRVCRDCYRLTINCSENPFSIAHRRDAWHASEPRYTKRWISSIEPLEPADAMCVTVSAPDGLYLTNDYIVTHNSCTVAWLVLWAFTTFPDCRGTVTAETETQLRTKTWAELGKWFNLFFAKEYFKLTATSLLSRDSERERTWRIDAVPWSEKNPEAFAGLHNQGKRILLIFDEASRIDDIIWETAEGALTDKDTEILWCVFGNPTRNSGRFRECFPSGQFEKYWSTRQIDSRTVEITNKARCQYYIDAYGLDSDITRIRVLGQFPRRGLMEFFSAEEIDAAMQRDVVVSRSDPLAIGVDVARFGANASVIFFRKGRDARSIERQRFQGLATTELAEAIFNVFERYRPDGIMIDGGGVGGGVVDQVRQKRLHCYEVQFGGKDVVWNTVWGNDGERYANNRAAMYGACRAWLKTGALPNDPDLRRQMLAIRYTYNNKDEIILEKKEDLVDEDGYGISLDDIDALCLTFAHALAPHVDAGGEMPKGPLVQVWWDPYEEERMLA